MLPFVGFINLYCASLRLISLIYYKVSLVYRCFPTPSLVSSGVGARLYNVHTPNQSVQWFPQPLPTTHRFRCNGRCSRCPFCGRVSYYTERAEPRKTPLWTSHWRCRQNVICSLSHFQTLTEPHPQRPSITMTMACGRN